jgi:hypothetical protein
MYPISKKDHQEKGIDPNNKKGQLGISPVLEYDLLMLTLDFSSKIKRY